MPYSELQRGIEQAGASIAGGIRERHDRKRKEAEDAAARRREVLKARAYLLAPASEEYKAVEEGVFTADEARAEVVRKRKEAQDEAERKRREAAQLQRVQTYRDLSGVSQGPLTPVQAEGAESFAESDPTHRSVVLEALSKRNQPAPPDQEAEAFSARTKQAEDLLRRYPQASPNARMYLENYARTGEQGWLNNAMNLMGQRLGEPEKPEKPAAEEQFPTKAQVLAVQNAVTNAKDADGFPIFDTPEKADAEVERRIAAVRKTAAKMNQDVSGSPEYQGLLELDRQTTDRLTELRQMIDNALEEDEEE